MATRGGFFFTPATVVGGDETLALKLYSDLFAKPSLRNIYVYITLLI